SHVRTNAPSGSETSAPCSDRSIASTIHRALGTRRRVVGAPTSGVEDMDTRECDSINFFRNRLAGNPEKTISSRSGTTIARHEPSAATSRHQRGQENEIAAI